MIGKEEHSFKARPLAETYKYSADFNTNGNCRSTSISCQMAKAIPNNFLSYLFFFFLIIYLPIMRAGKSCSGQM